MKLKWNPRPNLRPIQKASVGEVSSGIVNMKFTAIRKATMSPCVFETKMDAMFLGEKTLMISYPKCHSILYPIALAIIRIDTNNAKTTTEEKNTGSNGVVHSKQKVIKEHSGLYNLNFHPECRACVLHLMVIDSFHCTPLVMYWQVNKQGHDLFMTTEVVSITNV